MRGRMRASGWLAGTAAALLWALPAGAQTCQTGAEMPAATRSALERTAQQYFAYSAAGDYAALLAASIPRVAREFGAIADAVGQHQEAFRGARAVVRASYLLEAEGTAPLEEARFYCGIWNSPERTAFFLPGLAPGRYGLVILDVAAQPAHTLSLVLQEEAVQEEAAGGRWRLAGYYVRSSRMAGHDAGWYWERAREFAQRGQRHNAWFYYLMVREMLAPVPFMSTRELDRLYDESEQVLPAELPYQRPLELAVKGETRRITAMFPAEDEGDLLLVVRWEAADVSDARRAHEENLAVLGALVERYPQYREAFAGVVARATEPGGRDYGSLVAMKDLK
jgi:hypothetical protein